MKPFNFSDPASEELAAAVRWFEQRRPGWGGRLFTERAEHGEAPAMMAGQP